MTSTKQSYSDFADVNGTRIYYEVAGEGHPLVLLHSGYSNRKLWDDQFEVFAQFYKVIRCDLRGSGDSAVITAKEPPYTDWEDLYELLRFLEIEKTYLIGVSGGGATAIDFTLAQPEMVDALIPVSMGVSGFDFGEWIEASPLHDAFARQGEAFESGDVNKMAELSLPLWAEGPERLPEQISPLVREHIREMCIHNWTRPNDLTAPQAQIIEPPALGRLAEIEAPTLIIVGKQDVPVILEIGDILAEEIKGARKVVFPDAGHHLNMEQPKEFNRVVLDFLRAL